MNPLRIVLDKILLNKFGRRLYENIGYSHHYLRHVIVEPVLLLQEKSGKIKAMTSVEEFKSQKNLGKHVAEFLDSAWGNDIDQTLLPYILTKEYSYIILSEDKRIAPIAKSKIVSFLERVKQNSQLIRDVCGIAHYHIDEPDFSAEDEKTLTNFSRVLISLGGRSQLGLLFSERNPADSLSLLDKGKDRFVRHYVQKVADGGITVKAKLFGERSAESSFYEVVCGH